MRKWIPLIMLASAQFVMVLVIPAIAALTAAGYEGKDRALAYALLGGVAAIAVAAGPLIGGWVTTEYSWRYVFAAETVVVIGILLLRGRIPRAAAALRRPQLKPNPLAESATQLRRSCRCGSHGVCLRTHSPRTLAAALSSRCRS